MFLKPDFFARHGRISLPLSTASVLTALLTACSTGPVPQSAEAAVARAAAPTTVAAESGTRIYDSQAMPQARAAVPPASGDVVRILAYADRIRVMPPSELGQEVARLGNVSAPADQLQLALVLSQLHQPSELIRAQELLARVLGNAEAQALHPLARLLAARYGEQRRLEEQLEKQNQQVRDIQRRLDQTNERLEALKAIERSLTSRSPGGQASPAPAKRSRSAAP